MTKLNTVELADTIAEQHYSHSITNGRSTDRVEV